MFRKRGQSMIEYVLLVTVLVLGMVWAVNSVIKGKVESQITAAGNMTAAATGKFINVTK